MCPIAVVRGDTLVCRLSVRCFSYTEEKGKQPVLDLVKVRLIVGQALCSCCWTCVEGCWFETLQRQNLHSGFKLAEILAGQVIIVFDLHRE